MSINGYGNVLANSWGPPERRKSAAELKHLSHDDRLYYEMHAPPATDDERAAELEREDLRHRLGMGDDELSWQDLDRAGPPNDWGI